MEIQKIIKQNQHFCCLASSAIFRKRTFFDEIGINFETGNPWCSYFCRKYAKIVGKWKKHEIDNSSTHHQSDKIKWKQAKCKEGRK